MKKLIIASALAISLAGPAFAIKDRPSIDPVYEFPGFLEPVKNIVVKLVNLKQHYKTLCEDKLGGIYMPSEELFRKSGGYQLWGCFRPEIQPEV